MVYIILKTATFPLTLKNPKIGSTVIHILNYCATAMALLLDIKKAKKNFTQCLATTITALNAS